LLMQCLNEYPAGSNDQSLTLFALSGSDSPAGTTTSSGPSALQIVTYTPGKGGALLTNQNIVFRFNNSMQTGSCTVGGSTTLVAPTAPVWSTGSVSNDTMTVAPTTTWTTGGPYALEITGCQDVHNQTLAAFTLQFIVYTAGNIIYVNKSSGMDAYVGSIAQPKQTIQAGITALAPCATSCAVLVSGVQNATTGDYYTSATGPVITMSNNISVYGGYAGDFSLTDPATYQTILLNTQAAGCGGAEAASCATVYADNTITTTATSLIGFGIIGNSQGLAYSAGVHVVNATLTLIGNNIVGSANSTTQSAGVLIDNSASAGSLIVGNNVIDGGTSTGNTFGIRALINARMQAIRNTIKGGGGSLSSTALYSGGLGIPTIVSNNYIDGGTGPTAYGISSSSSLVHLRLWNNTIQTGRNTGATNTYGIYFNGGAGVTPQITNNIVFGATSGNDYCVFENSAVNPTDIHNNNFYLCDVLYHDSATGDESNIANINAYANSVLNISVDPQLRDATNYDFALTANTPCLVTTGGETVAGVIDDREGNARTAAYSIGASERDGSCL
ncbi:MAG: Ig-like domain-containing protein, partial [Leptospiraceae bacterium]|nr:Ig-like domain-containing protein [Leptospiraceae bacterium]